MVKKGSMGLKMGLQSETDDTRDADPATAAFRIQLMEANPVGVRISGVAGSELPLLHTGMDSGSILLLLFLLPLLPLLLLLLMLLLLLLLLLEAEEDTRIDAVDVDVNTPR